jgi:hypothetical protein
VFLAGHDVPTERLDGAGSGLLPLLGSEAIELVNHAELEEYLVAFSTPSTGWRVLTRSEALDSADSIHVLCGTPEEDGRWSVASVDRDETGWRLRSIMSSQLVHAGRAKQRQQLVFRWGSTVLRARQDELGHLTTVLENVSSEHWEEVNERRSRVVGWLSDEETGAPLAREERFAYAPYQGKQKGPITLEPGESIELPVRMLTLATDTLASGRYLLRARLIPLDLVADAALLVVPALP